MTHPCACEFPDPSGVPPTTSDVCRRCSGKIGDDTVTRQRLVVAALKRLRGDLERETNAFLATYGYAMEALPVHLNMDAERDADAIAMIGAQLRDKLAPPRSGRTLSVYARVRKALGYTK